MQVNIIYTQEVTYGHSIGTESNDIGWPWSAQWPLFWIIWPNLAVVEVRRIVLKENCSRKNLASVIYDYGDIPRDYEKECIAPLESETSRCAKSRGHLNNSWALIDEQYAHYRHSDFALVCDSLLVLSVPMNVHVTQMWFIGQ